MFYLGLKKLFDWRNPTDPILMAYPKYFYFFVWEKKRKNNVKQIFSCSIAICDANTGSANTVWCRRFWCFNTSCYCHFHQIYKHEKMTHFYSVYACWTFKMTKDVLQNREDVHLIVPFVFVCVSYVFWYVKHRIKKI